MRIGLYRGDAASGPIDKILDAARDAASRGLLVVLVAADDGHGRDGRARRGWSRGPRHRAGHHGGADVPASPGGDGAAGAHRAVDQRRPVHPRDRVVAPTAHRGQLRLLVRQADPAHARVPRRAVAVGARRRGAGRGRDDHRHRVIGRARVVAGAGAARGAGAADAPARRRARRRHRHVDVRAVDARAARGPDDQRRGRGSRPRRTSDRCRVPRLRHRRPGRGACCRVQHVRGLRHAAVVPGDAGREGAEGPADVAIVGDEATVGAQLDVLRAVGVTDFVASVFGTPDDRARTYAYLASLL